MHTFGASIRLKNGIICFLALELLTLSVWRIRPNSMVILRFAIFHIYAILIFSVLIKQIVVTIPWSCIRAIPFRVIVTPFLVI